MENRQNDKISAYDKIFLLDLISSEKKRKPDLNIHLSNSPAEFSAEIKLLKINKQDFYSGQYIVNMGMGPHYAALDVFIDMGKISVIGIEPANFNNMSPSLLLVRLLSRMNDVDPSAKVVMLESDIQQSPVDCAIFSLHFALKMHVSKSDFECLHKKHMNGGLDEDITEGYIPKDNVDKYLPVKFMKHTNSKNRLKEYFRKNENIPRIAEMEKTIIEHQGRFIFERKHRNYSASIEDKRIKLIERAIKNSITFEGTPNANRYS